MKNFMWSPSKSAFYPVVWREEYVASGNWPEDCIEVDDSLFTEYTQKAPAGKVLGVGNDGMPVWINAQAKTTEQLIAEAEAQRVELLELYKSKTANWNTDLLLGDISDDDRAKLKAWVAWRKVVESIDVSTASKGAPIIFPESP